MPLPKDFDTKLFLQELDKKSDFVGCRVVYFDDALMTTIRPGPPLSRADLVAVVIRKGGKNILPTNADVQRVRDERFHAELLNLGMSCGGAALAWVTTVISGAAVPVTGGLSLIITVASSAATAAGYVQCGVAAYRLGAHMYDPQLTIDLDNDEWYQTASTALDVIGLAGASAAAYGTAKALILMKNAGSKPLAALLKGLSRGERLKLTAEILQSTNPKLSSTQVKMMQLSNPGLMRYAPKAISDGVRRQLLEVVGAMGNITGSAISGTINQAVSVVTEDYAIGLVSAYETQ